MSPATVQQPAPTHSPASVEVLPHAHAMCVAAGHIGLTHDAYQVGASKALDWAQCIAKAALEAHQ